MQASEELKQLWEEHKDEDHSFICIYGGDVISQNERKARYFFRDSHGRQVEPAIEYGYQPFVRDIFDAACVRGAGAYANDYRKFGQPRPWPKPNAEFYYDSEKNQVWLRATRIIRKGDEVLLNYGSDYWKGHGPEYFTSDMVYRAAPRKPRRRRR